MKNRPNKTITVSMFFLAFVLTFSACGTASPASTTAPSTATSVLTEETATTAPTETTPPTQTQTVTPSLPTQTITPTITMTPTKTETFGEMFKSRIVFYLLRLTDTKRKDGCGAFTVEPIISKRYRTGDKVQDLMIALNMLFSVGSRQWGAYYNALWDTQFTIENYEYRAKTDYIIIQFGGDFPYVRLTSCDKHGIREQIWTTWRHYGFKEKTFKVADGFLIDRLGGD